MKSLKKQLQMLFAYAGYKTNGVYLLPNAEYVPPREGESSTGLAYKIDIGHQLYNYYKEEDFKFSEKGTTPKAIAEEIVIYLYQSQHLKIEIDSFGNFQVRPTKQYFDDVRNQVQKEGKVRYTPLRIDNFEKETWFRTNKLGVLYEMEDLSLSALRMANYLELIVKKSVLFQEYCCDQITKIIDLSALNSSQTNIFLQSNFVSIDQNPSKLILNREARLNISKKANIQFHNHHSEIQLDKDRVNLIGSCLRHKSIPYAHKYSSKIEQHSSNILKFAEIYPKITIEQLQAIYGADYRVQIDKIMKYCLQFETKQPVHLKKPNNFIDKTICDDLLHKNSQEQLLILLDYLGDDDIYLALRGLQTCLRKPNPLISSLASTLSEIGL